MTASTQTCPDLFVVKNQNIKERGKESVMYFLSLTPSWHKHANEQNSFKCRQFLPHLARQNKQRRRSYVCCLILYSLLCVEHIERRVQVELCTRCGQGDEQTCKMSSIFLQTCLALRGRRGRSKDWNFEEKCFEMICWIGNVFRTGCTFSVHVLSPHQGTSRIFGPICPACPVTAWMMGRLIIVTPTTRSCVTMNHCTLG